jgi:hypothetical protein
MAGMLHLRTTSVTLVQVEPVPYSSQSASEAHHPQTPKSEWQMEPERRREHSAVALQVAQVEVMEEQMGAASGHVEELLQNLHSPLFKSQDSSLEEAAQHWA